MSTIEIPDPMIVVTGSVTYLPSGDHFDVWVEVGGVVVMKRNYTDANPTKVYPYPENFAYDMNEAKEKISTAFGKAIQRLIGEVSE